jgi:hypothetical protein
VTARLRRFLAAGGPAGAETVVSMVEAFYRGTEPIRLRSLDHRIMTG